MGRDPNNVGIMSIRGKMINGLKAQDYQMFGGTNDKGERVNGNEEIKLLLYALGIDIGNYNSRKLRYGKLAITVDADADGFSIALLILANLYKLCPQFIKENRVCWLRCPLYIEEKNDKPVKWWYTDEEFNKDRSKVKYEIKRIKRIRCLIY